jgi:hypothetical protein
VASLLEEFGVKTSKTGVSCPKCGADMQPEAIICVDCGFNTKTGKQIATESDKAAQRRREAEFQRQREAADRAERARKIAAGEGKAAQAATSEFAWTSRGASFRTLFASTVQIVTSPAQVFGNLPAEGGTGHAISFPVWATLFVGLVYGLIYAAITVFTVVMAMPGDMSALPMAIGIALGVMAAMVAAGVVASSLGVIIGCMCIAGLAQLILRYVGNSPRGYGSTFRCTLYVLGVIVLLGAVPIAGIAAMIYAFVLYAYALIAHHRVAPGVGATASIVGLLGYYVLVFTVLLLTMGALMAMLQQFTPAAAT